MPSNPHQTEASSSPTLSWRLVDSSGQRELFYSGACDDQRGRTVGSLTLLCRDADGVDIWRTSLHSMAFTEPELRRFRDGLWQWKQTYEQGFALQLSRSDNYHPGFRISLAPNLGRPRGKAHFAFEWSSIGVQPSKFEMATNQSSVSNAIAELDSVLRPLES